MRNIFAYILFAFCVTSAGFSSAEGPQAPQSNNQPAPNFYTLQAQELTGAKADFASFKGKVVMIVNTASKCGFTPQYEDLQQIYEKYKNQGFVVLGFPSNDFMNQEPGSAEEIKNFCKSKYNVSFPIFEKNPVSGKDKQPVYKFLTEQTADEFKGEIRWNFEKFLIDRKGSVQARYGSFTNPASSKVITKIEELIAEAAADKS